jgi:hypothetical protein
MARRHVLGTLHARCEAISETVPVYLAVTDGEPELIGHVDESHGRFADAMSFHLADDVCKKLSAGHYTYSFEYDHAGEAQPGAQARIVLRSITLNARKGYPKPEPRSKAN